MVVVAWSMTLMSFGTLGVVSMLLPLLGRRIVGLGLEVVARLVLGSACLVYAGAVFTYTGWARGGFVILTYLGMTALLWVGAWQITRWLQAQGRAVARLKRERRVRA